MRLVFRFFFFFFYCCFVIGRLYDVFFFHFYALFTIRQILFSSTCERTCKETRNEKSSSLLRDFNEVINVQLVNRYIIRARCRFYDDSSYRTYGISRNYLICNSIKSNLKRSFTIYLYRLHLRNFCNRLLKLFIRLKCRVYYLFRNCSERRLILIKI